MEATSHYSSDFVGFDGVQGKNENNLQDSARMKEAGAFHFGRSVGS